MVPESLIGDHIPPLTWCQLVLSFVLMLLTSLDILTPYDLYLNWKLVLDNFQFHRLATTFFYYGDFGLHYFWNAYMIYFYCGSLEENVFRNRPAHYLWMFTLCASLLALFAFCIGGGMFLSGALTNVFIYYWSRKNPYVSINVLLFSVRAAYLPWFLTFLSVVVGWGIGDHLLGIIVGHIYYFFTDVYPLMPTSKGFRLFDPPAVLERIVSSVYAPAID